MTTTLEAQDAVARGAAFMDEHDPPWWREDTDQAIDLDTLDLSDPAACILGQRCPLEVLRAYALTPSDPDPDDRYWAYAAALRDATAEGATLPAWAESYGFVAPDGNWKPLTGEWRRVIAERRAAATAGAS